MTSERPPHDQPLWNPAIETLSAEALRDLQWWRLRSQLRYDVERSPVYRAKFEAAGLTPGDIHGWEDFERLPLMTKDEHRQAQEQGLEEHGDPLALLNCAPREEVVRINATSGTTGMPTLYALTQDDVDVVNEMHARKYWRAGIRPGDVIIQALSLSMFTGGLPLSQGIMHLGAACVPVGVEGGTKRVLDFVKLTKPSAMVATPSFGQYLIEECRKHTGEPAAALGITRFFCAGEPGGGDPAVRVALSEGFGGASVFDHTGGGHAFHAISRAEPADQFSGMYFVSGDHCLLELVDPESKAPIALADGAVGEMVWTFLQWQGGPFLRYAMGDVAEVFTSPCPSGTPGLRFRIIGRADDMLIVKGVNVYPAAIQNVIFGFRPQVTGAFRIALPRPGPKVTPPLQLRIEHGEGIGGDELDALGARINDELREALRVSARFEWLAPGTLPRAAHKIRLVEKSPARHDRRDRMTLQQALDFREECDVLSALLEPLGEGDWERVTQFKDWTVSDVIAHLHFFNVAADLSLSDPPAFDALLGELMQAITDGEGHLAFTHRWLKGLPGRALFEQWRDYYLGMAERFGAADPEARVKWAGPDMSVRMSITARQMETWAHGQELFDLLGVQRTGPTASRTSP